MSIQYADAHALITDLLAVYTRLAQLPSLAPTPTTNRLFSQLVALTASGDDTLAARVLADPQIQALTPHLRWLSANGEYALETYWAKRLIDSPQPQPALMDFMFYDNYVDLVRLEYGTLCNLNPQPCHTALLVGSGPLPLTALLLSGMYKLAATLLDKDAAALHLSITALRHLQPTVTWRAFCTDILNFTALADYDFIHLAALAGVENETKARIIAHLYQGMKPGAFLLLRGADGLRTLLYPPITLAMLAGFTLQVSVRPLNHIVNSFIIVQK